MRVALLQSVAVLAGISPVLPRPATSVDGSRSDEAVEPASRVGPRGSDALVLSPAALGERDDRTTQEGRETDQGEEPARPDAGPAAAPAPASATAPAPREDDARAEGDGDADDANPSRSTPESDSAPAGPRGRDGEPLTDGEQRKVQELQARDQEVRTHEQAHKAAGGRYAGAINYEYSEGPDGRRYATGGSVSIDAGPVPGDPEATVAKMQVVRAAALAPAEPSSQDRKVAAQADRTAAEARQEIAREAATPADPEADDAQTDAADGPRGVEGSPNAADRPGAAPDAAATAGNGPLAATPDGRPNAEPAPPPGSDPGVSTTGATDPAPTTSAKVEDQTGAPSAATRTPTQGRLELAAAAYRQASNSSSTPGTSSGFDPAAWAANAVRGPRLDLVA